MTRRTVLLFLALLVAALGTAAVFVYVNGINKRAIANQQPVRVLVAKQFIPLGTPVSSASASGAFFLRSYPKDLVPVGSIANTAGIASDVAITAIYPGQQIVTAEFGPPGAASALPIPGHSLAISVQFNDPNRVAGFVQPGSYVAVFDTVSGTSGTGAAAAQPVTRLLLPRAEVIAVGPDTLTPITTTNPRTGQVNTQQISQTILTLALSQQEAERVIFAQQGGSLYLGLLTSSSQVAPDTGINNSNLFG